MIRLTSKRETLKRRRGNLKSKMSQRKSKRMKQRKMTDRLQIARQILWAKESKETQWLAITSLLSIC